MIYTIKWIMPLCRNNYLKEYKIAGKNKLSSKQDWRATLLARRRQITAAKRQEAASSACAILHNHPIFQNSQHIACYYPLQDEFNCLPLIQAIWDAHKNCYLPIIADRLLHFKRYQASTLLKPNRYHIPEPANEDFIAVEKLDLVIVPLVGFDGEGHRLGMGAGYYDRTFQDLTCNLMGLAYASQQVPELPFDPWDISLSAVLTEKKIITFK